MSKNITQLTESTTIKGEDVLHFVDVTSQLDKHIKAANLWNGKPYGGAFLNGNATATTIAASSVFYNIATGGVTTTTDLTNYFTHDAANCRLTYTGEEDIIFSIEAILSAISTTGTISSLAAFYVNGTGVTKSTTEEELIATTRTQMSVKTILQLSKGDYVEVFISNQTGATNITVKWAQFIIKAL